MRTKKIIVLFIVITVLLIPFSCFAMSPDEFFDTYDYEYKYMIKLSSGSTNYVSSENPIDFSMSKYSYEGEELQSGNTVVMYTPGTYYWLRYNGEVYEYTNYHLHLFYDQDNLIGYDYADIYRRSGDSFFLPNDLKHSPFRQILVGLTPILGCLILALSLRKAWAFLRGQLTT